MCVRDKRGMCVVCDMCNVCVIYVCVRICAGGCVREHVRGRMCAVCEICGMCVYDVCDMCV